jgi:hypothetical protein
MDVGEINGIRLGISVCVFDNLIGTDFATASSITDGLWLIQLSVFLAADLVV